MKHHLQSLQSQISLRSWLFNLTSSGFSITLVHSQRSFLVFRSYLASSYRTFPVCLGRGGTALLPLPCPQWPASLFLMLSKLQTPMWHVPTNETVPHIIILGFWLSFSQYRSSSRKIKLNTLCLKHVCKSSQSSWPLTSKTVSVPFLSPS